MTYLWFALLVLITACRSKHFLIDPIQKRKKLTTGAGRAVPARYSDEAPLHQASPGVSEGPSCQATGATSHGTWTLVACGTSSKRFIDSYFYPFYFFICEAYKSVFVHYACFLFETDSSLHLHINIWKEVNVKYKVRSIFNNKFKTFWIDLY